MTPWRPVRPRSRRCEKKSSGSQAVQCPIRPTDCTPASLSACSVAAARSSLPLTTTPSPQRLASERLHTCLRNPLEETSPADVQNAEPRNASAFSQTRDRHRVAIRGHERHGLAGPVGPQTVALVEGRPLEDPARPGLGDLPSMHLPRHRGRLGVGAHGSAGASAVLDDAVGIVVGQDSEVQRLEVAFAHAPEARRERDPEGRRRPIPLDEVHVARTRTSMTSRTKTSASVMTRVN
jgi:hypothetical protein